MNASPGTWIQRDDGLIIQVCAWASSPYELAGLDIYGRTSKIGTRYTVITAQAGQAARDKQREQAKVDGRLRVEW